VVAVYLAVRGAILDVNALFVALVNVVVLDFERIGAGDGQAFLESVNNESMNNGTMNQSSNSSARS
jgi:hypothetical protein